MYSDIEENRNKSNHITLCQFRWDEMRGGVMGSDQIRWGNINEVEVEVEDEVSISCEGQQVGAARLEVFVRGYICYTAAFPSLLTLH